LDRSINSFFFKNCRGLAAEFTYRCAEFRDILPKTDTNGNLSHGSSISIIPFVTRFSSLQSLFIFTKADAIFNTISKYFLKILVSFSLLKKTWVDLPHLMLRILLLFRVPRLSDTFCWNQKDNTFVSNSQIAFHYFYLTSFFPPQVF